MTAAGPDSLTGCLLGLALGDALGFVVEAEPPEGARGYVEGWLRQGRAGQRAHPGFPFGQYSDDTQLARELLLSVRDAGGWDPGRFAHRVAELFREGREVGAGPGTRAAAFRVLAGVPWCDAGTPAPYAGNGSAMRVAPVGALFPDPLARRVAREQGLVTHRDSRCIAATLALTRAVALAPSGTATRPAEFLAAIADFAREADQPFADTIEALTSWLALPPRAAAAELHRSGLEPTGGEQWLGISAFVVPSVLWSLYSFLRSPDDYWETVCTAIGVGGDTDTIAAIAGAISGARLGPGALPPSLLACLTDRGEWGSGALAELATECWSLVHG